MNIKTCQIFLTIADTGSLTQAAEKLNYTQSGLSHALNNLEEELNVRLIHRNKKGVQLTSEGMELLPYFDRIYHTWQELSDHAADMNALNYGTIRIGVFPSAACHLLPAHIREFQALHPGIQIQPFQGNFEEIDSLLTNDLIDLGFLCGSVSASLEFIPLLQDNFEAILPEHHPLTAYDLISVEQLTQYPFILLDTGHEKAIESILGRASQPPDIYFKTQDNYTVISMVENGLGIGILPQLVLKHATSRIEVRHIATRTYRTIGIAYKRNNIQSRATASFLDYIRKCYGKM